MEKATARATALLLLLVTSVTTAQTLNPAAAKAVQAATFEVLAPGAQAGSNGVVGTAFAIGSNEYITAAHTFDQIIGSRFARPLLMDSNRVGYEIADILHYSQQQDYVAFSLASPPNVVPLEVRRDDPAPRDVYFAGRRSGGGIVIKRGIFKGQTREEESGQFDWLRFTSPVWAGVSGGPLLDASGDVIGIVRARARDGTANYAVPIGLVPAGPPDRAYVHSLELLRPLGPATYSDTPFEAEIPLPMSYEKFSQELVRLRTQYFDQTVGRTLDATRGHFVLTGRGAAGVCELLNGQNCECKSPAETNGVLLVDEPEADALTRRAKSGADVTQIVAGAVVVRTRGSTGTHAPELSKNPLLHLKLALKGQSSPDLMLPASARRADVEAADLEDVYTDFRGRAWQVRTWPLADQDLKVVSLGRELPEGYVVLMSTVPTAVTYGALLQLKFVSNLVYYGCGDLPALDVAQAVGVKQRLEGGKSRWDAVFQRLR
jgi:serine protease Do